MGKPTGFLEYARCSSPSVDPLARIRDFSEFHLPRTTASAACRPDAA